MQCTGGGLHEKHTYAYKGKGGQKSALKLGMYFMDGPKKNLMLEIVFGCIPRKGVHCPFLS